MLLNFLAGTKVYVAAGATDLRKSFDGLAQLARERVRQDPLSGALFVFCNRGRNRIRLLYWDGSGYWLLTKRLEEGTFAWPQLGPDPEGWRITSQQLLLLLSGIDLARTKARPWYGREGSREARRNRGRHCA